MACDYCHSLKGDTALSFFIFMMQLQVPVGAETTSLSLSHKPAPLETAVIVFCYAVNSSFLGIRWPDLAVENYTNLCLCLRQMIFLRFE